MAYQKKDKAPAKSGTTIRSEVKNLLLYIFEIKESKSGEFLLIRAKMSSKPVEGEKYGKGINVNLMAKIADALIDDDVDEGMWVRVDGTIGAEDWKSKNSSGTQLNVYATKISVSEKK